MLIEYIHAGKNNLRCRYIRLTSLLAVITCERDLVGISLKNTSCVQQWSKKQMLGIKKKEIENKTENVIMILYKSIVHPHPCSSCPTPAPKGYNRKRKIQIWARRMNGMEKENMGLIFTLSHNIRLRACARQLLGNRFKI